MPSIRGWRLSKKGRLARKYEKNYHCMAVHNEQGRKGEWPRTMTTHGSEEQQRERKGGCLSKVTVNVYANKRVQNTAIGIF